MEDLTSSLRSRPLRAIGLMSGTSLDGIDAALLLTDGHSVLDFGPVLTLAYDMSLQARLRRVLAGGEAVLQVEREITILHAEAVERLLAYASLSRDQVDVIGFHGQTVLHRPDLRLTRQIGDGAALACLTGIDVVSDFRSADIGHGGQGAPLVPIYHAALAYSLPERPIAVLNLGGIGNVTWISSRDGQELSLFAFDTGPGNALINDWVLHYTGQPLDRDGAFAQSGRVDEKVLVTLAEHPYFARSPPKSLDRDDFSPHHPGMRRPGKQNVAYSVLARFADPSSLDHSLSLSDGAATLTAFTALAVACAVSHLPHPPARWLICGGGRRNPALITALRQRLTAPIDLVERIGWNGDALEAQAFAFLAVRALYGLPLTFPGTTGAPYPLTGGLFFYPVYPFPSIRA